MYGTSTSTNVTITANVDRHVTSADVERALRTVARDNGVTLADLSVRVEPAEARVSVTMTESERTAFEAWRASNTSA